MEQDFDAMYTGRAQVVNVPSVNPSDIIKRKREAQQNSHDLKSKSDIVKQKKSIEIKRKSAKIRDFTNTVSEISPLIDVSASNCASDDDFKESLLTYYCLEQKLKKHIFEKMGITAYTPEIKSSGFNLGHNISKLISSGTLCNFDEDRINLIIDMITDANQSSNVVKDLYEQNVITTDTLVNIKCSIFPYAIRIESILDKMGYYGDKKHHHVKWFHNMALTLAKDIAFNWDKHSGFREREILFENMLKYCCEISMDTWLTQILESLDTDYIHITESNLMDYLPKFKAATRKYTMGYESHSKYNFDWLESEFSSYVYNLISDKKISEFNNKQNGIYFGKLVKLVDETLEKSWITWSEEIIEMIQNMSKQEQAEWFQGEGSKPMKTIGIKEDLISFIDEDIHNHLEIFTVHSDLEKRSKTRLAILWGMSNAICKKKNS